MFIDTHYVSQYGGQSKFDTLLTRRFILVQDLSENAKRAGVSEIINVGDECT
ncbi:hypothetical protein IPF37_00020 [bacterium]|nr:MAG: hypothetical protein IPF37_00020 [bacterium]